MAMKKRFDQPLTTRELNLDAKNRSNLFAWRGQFSPELIENLIKAYCPRDAIILDPFCGSGTVLYEAVKHNHKAYGAELNPAAYILSKTYELFNINLDERRFLIHAFTKKFNAFFPQQEIFSLKKVENLSIRDFQSKIAELTKHLNEKEKILLHTFVILMDVHNRTINTETIYSCFYKLISTVNQSVYSPKAIHTILSDARKLPIEKDKINFVITSPPYVNVFNYHQNYRKSAELLGWDLLDIAKSEIGSNRANRKNRFLTVIQYSIDMALALLEIHRVSKPGSKQIFVVGHESRVLGVPFYNAQIISDLAVKTGLYEIVLRQNRTFKNKFGKMIREDLLHFENTNISISLDRLYNIARQIAENALRNGKIIVPEKNQELLSSAIKCVSNIYGTRLYNIDYTSQQNEISINSDSMRAKNARLSNTSLQ